MGLGILTDLTNVKECEVCGNQAYNACAGCGKFVCFSHGENKVEENGNVVFYCNDHK
jgi:hypothetical protein